MSVSNRAKRAEANRIVDEALKGGISFMFDDDRNLMRWSALPDVDPGPQATWDRLCGQFDANRRACIREIRRRLPRNGTALMGTPLLEPDEPLVTKETLERAWVKRDEALW